MRRLSLFFCLLLMGCNDGWERIDPGWPHEKTKALAVHEGKLCTGFWAAKDTEVWCLGKTWKRIGRFDGANYVTFLASHAGNLYAGIDSGLWRYRGKKWKRLVSLDGCVVYSGAVHELSLYIGTTECGARLYRLDGENLTPVWTGPEKYAGIYELHSRDGLYIGAINNHGPGAVFRYGSEVDKIGGDGLNGSWVEPGFGYPESFTVHDGSLIVTFSNRHFSSTSPVWSWDGKTWEPLGPAPEEWSERRNFNASASFNGTLLVSAGRIPGRDAEVWAYDNGWKCIKRFGSLANARAEYVYRFVKWNGKLVAGFGTSPGMAQVWTFTPQ